MKQSQLLLSLLTLIIAFSLVISGCSKKEDSADPETEKPVDPFELLIYENSFKEFKTDQLQASIKKSDLQFSTFGDMADGQSLGAFNKTYIFNQIENSESFILFDELGEPAFIYKVDINSGQKKESVVEFERKDANTFMVRMFYYDWTNRLGSLLFESEITKDGDGFQNTPKFINESFNSDTNNAMKVNRSFPAPLKRMEYLMKHKPAQSLKATQFGFDGWKESWDMLKNSSISDWLVQSRKSGVVLTLVGLGMSESVLAAPAGVWLMAGGIAMISTSTALEIVLNDKWSEFVNQTQGKLDALTNNATEIAGNTVKKFQGYGYDIKDHWLNQNTNKTSLEEIVSLVEEQELIVQKENLDDLPDSDGVLQIGLSWNTDETDIDLWVTDPADEIIYFGNPSSASGGYLDRDDTNGFGPENIYWHSNVPDGDYLVQTHFYCCGEAITDYTVKITNGLGFVATYQGSLVSSDQVNDVVRFRKNGDSITILN